jgi:hypothetical protein
VLRRLLLLIFILTFIYFCSERQRTNPFDSNYNRNIMPMFLSLIPVENCNQLSWDDPLFVDYSGFNIFRKLETDTAFQLLKNLPRGYSSCCDSAIKYGLEHNYYFTITGEGSESKPSAIKSTIPGPGYNWIVDKWGYQIFKTSYDTRYLVLRENKMSPPQDMAIAKEFNLALITFTSGNAIEMIDLSTGELINQLYNISIPYKACYDSIDDYFWVVDSSGSIYKISPVSFSVELIDNTLIHPIEISIAEQAGLIHIVDFGAKKILQYNREGNLLEIIDKIDSSPLQGPEKFIYDEQRGRSWFSDGNGQKDYIYTKLPSENKFQCIDSLSNAGDFELDPTEDAILLISLNPDEINNSFIMQLYANGDRQTCISDLIYPLDISINMYDQSILVADSYCGRVLHYTENFRLLGFSNFYNFPIKILIE